MMVNDGPKSSLHKASPPRRRPTCHDHLHHLLRLSAAAPCHGSLPAVVRSQQQQGSQGQAASSLKTTTTSNIADADDDESLQMKAATNRSPLLLAASIPPTVNWHLETRCNYRCKFCFATFEDVREYQQAVRQDQMMPAKMDDDDDSTAGSSSSSKEQRRLLSEDRQQLSLKVPAMLKEQGVSKLNFVGRSVRF